MVSLTADGLPSVLLVKPDDSLREQMRLDLIGSGYGMTIAPDERSALILVLEQQPVLVVIDITQTGDTGWQLCRQIRNTGNRVPILAILPRDGVDDRIACLEAGADDYLLKPYRYEIFIKLINLYLQTPTPTNEQLRFGELVLDLATRQAIRNGREIDLTMKEFELLKYLMSHPREVVTREQILENVWGYDFMGESNVIEVYIRYLRLKIEDEGEKRLIQTVRGVGYVLREP